MQVLSCKSFNVRPALGSYTYGIFIHKNACPIFSNKGRVPNKRRNFGYPHCNKRLPLISFAPLNEALIRIVTIFYYLLNQNAYVTSMITIKQ